MQRVCQFLRPAPCLLQQAGLDNLLVPLVFPSLKNARLPVGVHFCPIASPVRHLMAGIVSASFGSSDPITISCSLRFFLSTPFMLNSSSVSSRALLQHAYCISFVFNSRSRCVILSAALGTISSSMFLLEAWIEQWSANIICDISSSSSSSCVPVRVFVALSSLLPHRTGGHSQLRITMLNKVKLSSLLARAGYCWDVGDDDQQRDAEMSL